MTKPTAAIVGSGNIGTDLLYKLMRSDVITPTTMVGIEPGSQGLARASGLGLDTSTRGVRWLLDQSDPPDIVFEATSAHVHLRHAPLYAAANVPVVDLTPAGCGPPVVPTVNLAEHLDAPNVNLITCGGQATIPIVHAVSRVVPVQYAEIVSTVASLSAGPGTRANIDEFTRTTARGLESLGGAARGKAIIVLNPAQPPILMRNTIFCRIPARADEEGISASVTGIEEHIRSYVPGYRLRSAPLFDEPARGVHRVSILVEVTGAGDFLPRYAGNLDIMTASAVKVGEEIIRARQIAGAAGA